MLYPKRRFIWDEDINFRIIFSRVRSIYHTKITCLACNKEKKVRLSGGKGYYHVISCCVDSEIITRYLGYISKHKYHLISSEIPIVQTMIFDDHHKLIYIENLET